MLEIAKVQEKIDRYQKVATEKAQQREKAAGKLESAEEQLRNAGFATVADAEAFIATKTIELENKKAELLADIAEFEQLYKQHLGE